MDTQGRNYQKKRGERGLFSLFYTFARGFTDSYISQKDPFNLICWENKKNPLLIYSTEFMWKIVGTKNKESEGDEIRSTFWFRSLT